MKFYDKTGFPFVGYKNKSLRTFIRFVFQLIRGNIRIKITAIPEEVWKGLKDIKEGRTTKVDDLEKFFDEL